jgi:hypothetical protein
MGIEVLSLDRWEVLGGVLRNRTGECLSGTRLGSTQHPLYFLRTHSRARSCAVDISAGVIFFSKSSLNLASIRNL